MLADLDKDCKIRFGKELTTSHARKDELMWTRAQVRELRRMIEEDAGLDLARGRLLVELTDSLETVEEIMASGELQPFMTNDCNAK